MVKLMISRSVSRLLLLILLPELLFINLAVSQTDIKTLPGFKGQLPFNLETGYVGLGKNDENLQLFYYFVESERNPRHDPVIIWINGGPGCSALWPFFYQIGPLKFDYANVVGTLPQMEINPYSWTKVASVIFVDASGSGFSYAKTEEAYKTSDTATAASIDQFLRKWLVKHPKYLSNPLYVAGVSYAGLIIPVAVQDIINGNEAGAYPRVNIKGYMGGNPLTDIDTDFNSRIPYAHQFALLSDEMFESADANCNGDFTNLNSINGLCQNSLLHVDECLKYINEHQILEPMCESEMTTKRMLQQMPQSSNMNLVKSIQLSRLPQSWCRGDNYAYATAWASDETVQKALHVREETIQDWLMCNDDHYELGRNSTSTFQYDITSTIGYHRNLTQTDCRALIFSGDHDLVFPYIGTQKWIHSLDLTVTKPWSPWFINRQVGGYTEILSYKDYSLTFATVKGAGHASPEYKPEECLSMVDRWLNSTFM
ncbi:serine carboxypeptidase-like 3 isoform X2 [Apium graveolens]|uniref:serine carboxypeptidase-like 3 isoform X2 n=1 Tax=Apium graveolens TaxID=4045 RepID=UPI003D798D09